MDNRVEGNVVIFKLRGDGERFIQSYGRSDEDEQYSAAVLAFEEEMFDVIMQASNADSMKAAKASLFAGYRAIKKQFGK